MSAQALTCHSALAFGRARTGRSTAREDVKEARTADDTARASDANGSQSEAVQKERKGPRQRLGRGPFREDIFGCDGDRIRERA